MPKTNCPVCGSNKKVFKIDEVYFGLLENDATFSNQFKDSKLQKSQVYKKLHPPALDKQPIWFVIAPDIIASIVLFIFLFLSIFNLLNRTQNGLAISIATIVLFTIFLFFRNKINNAFQINKAKREDLVHQTARKVELWSGLNICLSDGTIFNADHSINLGLDQFQNFLNEKD